METLAGDVLAPANADTAADAATTDADAEVANATGDGSAPSGTEAATPDTDAKRDKVQERIDRLTREKYDALRERDQRDYELERLRAQVQSQPAQTAQVAPEKFPTLEQCDFDEAKFYAAVSEFHTKAAEKVVNDRLTAEREQQTQAQRRQGWAKQEAEFIKSKPDYVEKVQMARTLPISHEAQQALMESELGPQVAYHLVENPDKAAAIMQLPIAAQLREIGRIEARLELAKTPPKPPVSQAPPPVAKVESVDSSVEKTPSDMVDATQNQFNKWRKKYMNKR